MEKHNFIIAEDKKLTPEFKETWLRDLRSGKYEQCSEQLALRTISGSAYCCLGVACISAGMPEKDVSTASFVAAGSVPDIIAKTYPEALLSGAEDDQISDYLANSNDDGASFEDIAYWIEENL